MSDRKKTILYCLLIAQAIIIINLLIFWPGSDSTDNGRSAQSTNQASRLIESGYWRLADWRQIGPGDGTDPNPGKCDQATEYSEIRGHFDVVYECLKRPTSDDNEEVVEMIATEALERFNLDDKPMAMRIISSYVVYGPEFPYQPTTPETCRVLGTNRVEDTLRSGDGLAAVREMPYRGPLYVSSYDYVISENCGDWTLDLESLKSRDGGAFYYDEPLDRFNADWTDFGVKPAQKMNYPSDFRYRPSTPQSCRYYLVDSSFSRQAVDDMFAENAENGVRQTVWVQNIDAGGWYDYSEPVTVGGDYYGHVFMIAENCGDWVRDDLDQPPTKNQIFDYPYESHAYTQTQGVGTTFGP